MVAPLSRSNIEAKYENPQQSHIGEELVTILAAVILALGILVRCSSFRSQVERELPDPGTLRVLGGEIAFQ